MARRLRLGIDFDGVVSDTIAAMIAYAAEHDGVTLSPRECLPPDGPARLGAERYQGLIAETHGTPYALEMPPIAGAVEALAALAARHDVVIVTARGGSAFVHAGTWLERAGVRGVLHDVVSAHGTTKPAVARRLRLDVVLDDWAANLAGMPPGVVPVLWTAAHNAGDPVPPPARRVDGWDAFALLVDRLAAAPRL